MIVLNLFGPPGVGKSTLAAATFAELKHDNINCELVCEFAKSIVWDNALELLQDQILIFAQQYHQIARLEGKVDVVVTDSPLLLSIVYGAGMSNAFHQLVLEQHLSRPSLNVFVKRVKPYHQVGRIQTELESHLLDSRVREILEMYHVNFTEVPGQRGSETTLTNLVKEYLKHSKK